MVYICDILHAFNLIKEESSEAHVVRSVELLSGYLNVSPWAIAVAPGSRWRRRWPSPAEWHYSPPAELPGRSPPAAKQEIGSCRKLRRKVAAKKAANYPVACNYMQSVIAVVTRCHSWTSLLDLALTVHDISWDINSPWISIHRRHATCLV